MPAEELSFTEGLLRRDRLVVGGGLVLLTALAWLCILAGAGLGMPAWHMISLSLFPHRLDEMAMGGMTMHPGVWSPAYWLIMLLMWWVMMVAMMTPSAFSDGEYDFLMSPEVSASVIDAAVRGLLTSTALRRPEVGRRLAIGANAVAPGMTLVDDPTTEGARVAVLEREVKRLSALALFSGLGLVTLLVLHFYPAAPELDGRTLTLRDGRGARRIELGFREDGSPMLRLNNPDQRARAMLFVADDGRATLRLSDREGKHRAQMLLEQDGRPVVTLVGGNGRSLVSLSETPEGSGELSIRDANGAPVAR